MLSHSTLALFYTESKNVTLATLLVLLTKYQVWSSDQSDFNTQKLVRQSESAHHGYTVKILFDPCGWTAPQQTLTLIGMTFIDRQRELINMNLTSMKAFSSKKVESVVRNGGAGDLTMMNFLEVLSLKGQ